MASKKKHRRSHSISSDPTRVAPKKHALHGMIQRSSANVLRNLRNLKESSIVWCLPKKKKKTFFKYAGVVDPGYHKPSGSHYQYFMRCIYTIPNGRYIMDSYCHLFGQLLSHYIIIVFPINRNKSSCSYPIISHYTAIKSPNVHVSYLKCMPGFST